MGGLTLRWVEGALHGAGEMDLSNAHELVHEVNRAEPSGGDLILDVSRLEFISSTGVQAIAAVCRAMGTMERRVVVEGATRTVRRMFTIIKLPANGELSADGELSSPTSLVR